MTEVAERFPVEYARWRAGEEDPGCEVEGLEDLGKRVGVALQEAAEANPGGTVVIATHGGAARQGCGYLLGWEASVLRSVGALRNCHWTELSHDEVRGWQLRAHNVGLITSATRHRSDLTRIGLIRRLGSASRTGWPVLPGGTSSCLLGGTRTGNRAAIGYRAGMPVAVVTDSTAYLPAELTGGQRRKVAPLTVVPLTVVLNGVDGLEGIEVSPADVTRALAERRVAVSTSRPAPEQFARAYRRLLDHGATGVVSVHLSAELSGTLEAAVLAAAEVGDRVTVVDSRSTGMGLGFPALAAAETAAGGADLPGVRRAALDAIDRTRTFFYVDTLEFLRRGGRINAAEALLGTALSVKPILHVSNGAIAVRDKVRTASRALARLVDLAVEAAGESEVDIAVHHLAAPQRAAELTEALAERLGDRLRDRYVTEAGAVVAAHVGPGLAGVVVHRR